eukprot:4546780-Prymnesium_polylepis.1
MDIGCNVSALWVCWHRRDPGSRSSHARLEFAKQADRLCERLCLEHPTTQLHGVSLKRGRVCLMQRVQGADEEKRGNGHADHDRESNCFRRAVNAKRVAE